MEIVAVAIRTIVILTLSTGPVFVDFDEPVFVDLDEPVSPAVALQIAQRVAKQDFEAIMAKVYYCPNLPLADTMKNTPAKPLAIAEVAKDWNYIAGMSPGPIPVAFNVMVITTSDFKTLGELARAIEEAKPKAKRSVIFTTEPAPGFGDYPEKFRPEPELTSEEAARFQIAEILVEEGKFAEAVNELEAVLESGATEEVKNLARARISTIYAKMGLDEKSEGELKKIIESTTNLELKKRALMTLAGIYRSQKRYDEAIVILRRVIELTQADVMKLLQFRREFMPEGFTLAAVEPDWPITENPGWLSQEGLKKIAKAFAGRLPRRGYICFFDAKGKATGDLWYGLLEFEDENTAADAAGVFSEKMSKEQSDRFGGAFAASNVVVIVRGDLADYILAGKWLRMILLNALPGPLQPKPTKDVDTQALREATNEVAAIKALRSLMAAEEEFRFADIIDQDSDGAGEYGFFQELCGTIAPPGHKNPISPKFLDPVFGIINASGAASKDGYYFRLFLSGPESAGPAVGETKGANSATDNADAINQRENRWVAYAWPMDYARTGRRAFVVNQAGKIFATAAMVATYDETAVMPGANAAFVIGTKNINGALADGVGVDGNTWHPVK